MKKVFIIFSGIALGAIFFFAFKTSQFYAAIYKPKAIQNSKFKIQNSEQKNVYNILLLGYGGPGHDGSYLTDTMMLVRADMKAKKILTVSLPRDIWVELPTRSKDPFGAKINSVYQIELFPETFPDVIPDSLTAQTVERITGLPVDYYIAMDFTGFKKALDSIGGIDINVQRAFTDKEYPVDGHETDLCGKAESDLPELEKIATESPVLAFPCRYEELHFDSGIQHMDSDRALKFVRSRHSDTDGGDFSRAARQQLFIEAVKNKIISVNIIPNIVILLDTLSDNITTDIEPAEIKKFVTEATLSSSKYSFANIVLSDNDYLDYDRSDDGQSILIPKAGKQNWSVVKKWILTH